VCFVGVLFVEFKGKCAGCVWTQVFVGKFKVRILRKTRPYLATVYLLHATQGSFKVGVANGKDTTIHILNIASHCFLESLQFVLGGAVGFGNRAVGVESKDGAVHIWIVMTFYM
jgi:hypothetical protein